MKKQTIETVIVAIVACALIICGILNGFILSELQRDALKTVSIVALAAALYCFVVGQLSGNNSQMDKLWSILPEIYLWIVAVKSGLDSRLVLMAVIATLWGIRLTVNFARKGAYSVRFWAGEEDYRWVILRRNKMLSSKFAWAMFNLFFISLYQNFIVLAITFPAIAALGSDVPFGVGDIVCAAIAVAFLILETVADEQQWKFHKEKKRQLEGGKKLSKIDFPYSRGFNTLGLWSCSRHPNYLGEQGIWVGIYLFSIAAGYDIINWSVLGAMLLILLFLGSSAFGESVSSSKYSEYKEYQEKISKYIPIPWNKYK